MYKNKGSTILSGNVTALSNVYISGGSFLVNDEAGAFQGTVAGYTSGGSLFSGGTHTFYNTVDRFPFASTPVTATAVRTLSQSRYYGAAQSSSVAGYTSGGAIAPSTPIYNGTNVIDKFLFASGSSATSVGVLAEPLSRAAGHSSTVSGYASSGLTSSDVRLNTIQKFSFSTDANATDVGDLSQDRHSAHGHSSRSHGYTSSGWSQPGINKGIIRFLFSTDTNSVSNAQELSIQRDTAASASSTTHGYSSTGATTGSPQQYTNSIEKFPFANDNKGSVVGVLSTLKSSWAGQSSTTHGHICGGFEGVLVTNFSTIDRFPFATDSNSTEIGNLSQARTFGAGQQD